MHMLAGWVAHTHGWLVAGGWLDAGRGGWLDRVSGIEQSLNGRSSVHYCTRGISDPADRSIRRSPWMVRAGGSDAFSGSSVFLVAQQRQ